MKIVGTNNESRCVYCNSEAYGLGCPYSPHKKHVHQDDNKRCVYCGSLSFGPGCPYNPFGKNHIHGVDYQQSLKEAAFNHFSVFSLIARLNEPITEMPAYKLGLIDENCRIVRLPSKDIERTALSSCDYYILKLRRALGPQRLDLLNSQVVLESLTNEKAQEEFDHGKYELEMKYQQSIKQIIENYKNLLREAKEHGMTLDLIETLLMRELLNEK